MSSWLEQAWLARYLDGELSTEERDQFEAYLLDKPHLIQAVEADNALREALVAGPQSLGQHAGRERRNGGSARIALAMAASFVAGLGLTWLGLQGNPQLDRIASPPRVVYDTLRGAPSEALVEAGDPGSPIVIVDVAMPSLATVTGAHAEVDGERFDLPLARISAEGFATYTLPQEWQGHATLHFELRVADDDAPARLEIAF